MQIKQILDEFMVPSHIRDHSYKVAKIAKKIASEYIKTGKKIDLDVLNNACLLHDLFKIVDLSESSYKSLCKSANGQTIEIWGKLRAKFKGIPHWEAAYQYLIKIGYAKEAVLIKKHYFTAVCNELDKPKSLEEKILTYADKRVMHDKIVSMQDRFKDGSRRYNNNGMSPEQEKKIHDEYFILEKELFTPINLKPEDIKE